MKRLLLLLITCLPLSAQNEEPVEEPAVLMSLAWNHYNNQRMGEAFIAAQKAWIASKTSEASYLIGLTYEAQAEHQLAKQYFERALDEDSFHKNRSRYLYSLANSYRFTQDYDKYLEILSEIEEEAFPAERYEVINRQRQQAVKILLAEGLNRVLQLYRWPHDSSLMATEALALNAYHVGDEEHDLSALSGFLYAVSAKTSTLINRMYYYQPDYQFTSLEQLLDDADLYAETREYIQQSQFFRSYYFLAASIYTYSGSSQSKVLFNRIRQRTEALSWAYRAQKQFDKPFFDSYTLEEAYQTDRLAAR